MGSNFFTTKQNKNTRLYENLPPRNNFFQRMAYDWNLCKIVPTVFVPGLVCTGSVSIKFRVGKFCFENIIPGFPWRTPEAHSALQFCIRISNPDPDLGAQSVGSYPQWIKELSTSGFLSRTHAFCTRNIGEDNNSKRKWLCTGTRFWTLVWYLYTRVQRF